MNSFLKKISTTLVVSLVMFSSSFQAIADDTEIFFSSVSLSGTTTIQPNVLMVLDTSGSMTNQVGDTGLTRLEHMKEAMHTILDSTNNINIGIMRFHRKGGPVLFPVADINGDASTVLGTAAVPGTFNRIKLPSDDVEQQQVTGSVVNANSDELLIGHTVGGGLLDCNDAGTITFETRIQNTKHDVEEENNGNIYHNSSDLELVKDDSNSNRTSQTIGLHFKDINIPHDVTIHCAEIEFIADGNTSTDTNLKVFIEDVVDASEFDINNNNDVSSRINPAADPHVAWDSVPPVSDDEVFSTPNLRSLVQGITDDVNWTNNNNMVFVINGSGTRRVESRDASGGAAKAPLLRISYTAAPVSSSPVRNLVGLRFDEVRIPAGATITGAYIDFTSTSESSVGPSTVLIGAEDLAGVGHSADFISGGDVTSRLSSPVVTWTPTPWVPNTSYTTPDLKTLVQKVVNDADWCGGNAMTFTLFPDAGTRKAVSDDGNSSISPALRIEFDESTADGCNAQQIQAQIKTDNDDAEEDTSGSSIGSMDLGSSDLELNADGSTSQLVGLRFQNVNVSSEDTITSAELEFTVDESNSGSTSVSIYGEYTGSAAAFNNSNSNISNRTRTTEASKVTWTPGPWATEGNKHVTPDISGIIQEIVAHSGWSALNDMAFIIEGGSGERTAESYDGDPISAAKLRINVEGSGTSSAGTVTVRDKLHNVVDEIQYANRTPIVDTLYEAGLYYRGGDVLFGKTRAGGETLSPLSENDGFRMRYSRTSHEASYVGSAPTRPGNCTAENLSHADCEDERIEGKATYISPISYECQDNHIILLSDGSPSEWHQDSVSSPYYGNVSDCAGSGDGKCGREIVSFLNTNDQIANSTLDEDQKITTHTIGFNFAGSTYLQDLASEGGGGFYEADTAAQLAAQFSEIFADVLASPTSFVAPAVTINTFNRLSHRDELYFALFEPNDSPRWNGNLKRYKLDSSGAAPIIVDATGSPAVDGSSGYFSSSARSWWTDTDGPADGQEIAAGGFAGELNSGTNRNLYTYTGIETSLNHAFNKLINTNNKLTDVMLDIVNEQAGDNTFRSNMLSWISGVDVLDENEDGNVADVRKYVGDPLHSRPALITYGKDANDDPDTVAYFGTNEGFIHALDVDDGAELFAFMPQELLPNIKAIMANQGTPADHKYGVDGTITAWVHDVNSDNDIEDSDGDHVYLYTGMRRGGNNYYALDVTNRDDPELLWKIQGGTGDFAELGQTWSQPVKSKVDIDGSEHDVLIFTGGYDENQDGASAPQSDNVGRALYIVDANTGARLWWAGPTGYASGAAPDLELAELTNSMPAKPAVIDIDLDGKVDHVYIGDLGGRVWRFDFTQGNVVGSFGAATVLATLGDTDSDANNDVANNRRFYHTPSVALKNPLASQTVYVTIGSGYHAHPLNMEAHDRFYVLEDSNVLNGAAMTLPLTEGALYDSTSNAIQDGSDQSVIDAAIASRSSASGWYLRLEESSTSQIGEKSLSRATIFDNVILFSTYLPEDPGLTTVAESCQAAAGFGRTYAVNLDDGSAVFNYDTTVPALNKADRYVTLNHVGIPPEVQIIIPEGSLAHGRKPVLLVGTEIVESDFDSPQAEMIYWNDQR